MECPKFDECPLFTYLKSSLEFWQLYYCKNEQRYKECARYTLYKSNQEVPANLLPNGKNLVSMKTDSEWKKVLDQDHFRVTREKGTEPPFSGKYNDFWEEGVYTCACCGKILFRSGTKFDAGCGWPSFWAVEEGENLLEIEDDSHGLERTEVICSGCDAHLGHVFDDGPEPTHLRYCINSLALRFESHEEKKKA